MTTAQIRLHPAHYQVKHGELTAWGLSMSLPSFSWVSFGGISTWQQNKNISGIHHLHFWVSANAYKFDLKTNQKLHSQFFEACSSHMTCTVIQHLAESSSPFLNQHKCINSIEKKPTTATPLKQWGGLSRGTVSRNTGIWSKIMLIRASTSLKSLPFIGISTKIMTLTWIGVNMYLCVLLHQLGEIVEEAVLRTQEIKLVVSLQAGHNSFEYPTRTKEHTKLNTCTSTGQTFLGLEHTGELWGTQI